MKLFTNILLCIALLSTGCSIKKSTDFQVQNIKE